MIFRNSIISVLLILSLNVFSQDQQKDCNVLLEKIAEEYSGECKNGLAHGYGFAKGIDTYKGDFKKGFPHGKGKYIWANGNYYDGKWKKGKKHGKGELYIKKKDSIHFVKYKRDRLVEKKFKSYIVNKSVNVNTVRFQKLEEILPGTIEITFDISKEKNFFNTLDISGSSGHAIKSPDYVSFKNVSFPFTAEIEFIVSGEKFIVTERCIVEFTIYEPGGWNVVIKQEYTKNEYMKERFY
ncbi:MAG: hypothetical protein R6V16_12470 [Bacteroidales bacterium]